LTQNNNMTDTHTSEMQEQIRQFCQEKGLEYDEVISAIEKAIASAYRKEFGDREKVYSASFDLDGNAYKVFEIIKVVAEAGDDFNPKREITIVDARIDNPKIQIGDEIKHDLGVEKQIGFGRIASQVAKQVLIYTVNNLKHAKILSKFKEFIGQIVTVEIDAFKRGGYLVKIGQGYDQTIGYIAEEDLLPIDHFRPGQLVKVLILDITEDDNKSSRIHLTRSRADFVKAIIAKEVPEVEAGVVNITKIVRDPGSRTKMFVSVNEYEDKGDIDPVGTILGRKNVRLLNIMREVSSTLQEKIDVIEWQPQNMETMVADALEPAEIDRIEFSTDDEGNTVADVFCESTEASLAVGRRGVNVRLASELLGMTINVNTLSANEKRADGPAIILD
jgi:transcription termination/antitermination protein NusA